MQSSLSEFTPLQWHWRALELPAKGSHKLHPVFFLSQLHQFTSSGLKTNLEDGHRFEGQQPASETAHLSSVSILI